jgi:hypothetical protein
MVDPRVRDQAEDKAQAYGRRVLSRRLAIISGAEKQAVLLEQTADIVRSAALDRAFPRATAGIHLALGKGNHFF